MYTFLDMFEYIYAIEKNETQVVKPKLTRVDVD
uniref:Uncharacterized protein n=1 Tax=Virus NIOZ-UU159 TaxID=2763270 RepID=A0A7S9XFT3_9VIRU|nr:MAG: hypothetical protein NIOZUU159_00122 [Virus NIOZ-UU159]